MKSYLHILVTLPMIKCFKVITGSVRALCADLLVCFSVLNPNPSVDQSGNFKYSQFYSTCVENGNLF